MKDVARVVPWLVAGLFLAPAAGPGLAAAGDDADRHYREQSWDEAAEAYRQRLAQTPEDSLGWYRLGVSLHNLERFGEAHVALERSLAAGPADQLAASARFWGARALARSGDTAAAQRWLEQAVELGFGAVGPLESSTDLEPLRGGEAFASILATARRNQAPCEHTESYRQFDFWVGDWDVYARGQKAGENRIERILGGCVLLENWTGAAGGSGKSFNFYDREDERWHQLWIDGQGGVLRLAGSFADGVMHYEGETVSAAGEPALDRLRFFDERPERVRQLWERSEDGGETWRVLFDGSYVARGSRPPKSKD